MYEDLKKEAEGVMIRTFAEISSAITAMAFHSDHVKKNLEILRAISRFDIDMADDIKTIHIMNTLIVKQIDDFALTVLDSLNTLKSTIEMQDKMRKHAELNMSGIQYAQCATQVP